jgi:hypothetical protein
MADGRFNDRISVSISADALKNVEDGLPIAKDTHLVWILFGWTGSTDQDLKAYSDAWHEIGISVVLRVITPPKVLLVSEEGVMQTLDSVVECVSRILPDDPKCPIVMQYFSDGGGTHHFSLWARLSQGKHSEFATRIVGSAFDSAPSPNKAAVFADGLVPPAESLNVLSIPGTGILRSVVRKGIILSGFTFRALVLTPNSARGYPDCIKEDTMRVPQLFVWSLSDHLTPEPHMRDIVGARRALIDNEHDGPVIEWVLQESPHCGHLATDREGYKQKIQEFLRVVEAHGKPAK